MFHAMRGDACRPWSVVIMQSVQLTMLCSQSYSMETDCVLTLAFYKFSA